MFNWLFKKKEKKPREIQLILVKTDSPVGKYLHLSEDEMMDSDNVSRVALIIANRQYEEFKNDN